MRKSSLYILVFLIISFVSSQQSWNTNIFDYTWNKNSRKMVFREPIIFSPFELRAGYFHYGGADYLDEFSLLAKDIGQHPVLLDSTHASYNGLSSKNDRNGIFIELDLLKTNLLLYIIPQNIFDVQFGLGYRMSHMLSHPSLPSDLIYTDPNENWKQYNFFPKIHDFNFNTTINWQFNEKIISYLYHSIGFSRISLYKTEADQKYLFGNAISETFSVGIKKMINNKNNKNYNFYYGFELKSIRTTTISLEDPHGFSPITGFDMRGVDFNLTFGVAFGGERTIGDEAFSMLLENNFKSAIPAFEEYIQKYPKHGKIKKAKKMLQFCHDQLPYQNYKKAINFLDADNINDAMIYLDDAQMNADDNLKIEINLTKEELAKKIIEDINLNFDQLSIRECESQLNIASELAPQLNKEVHNIKGNLFFKKATLLHESNLLIDALKYYKIALSYNESLSKLIEKRLDMLVVRILENSYEYKEKNEIILAIESLKIVIEIDQTLHLKLNPIIDILEVQLEEFENQKTQRAIQQIINDSKSRGNLKKDNLIIGMTKDKVINYINMPDSVEFINSSLDSFEIWIYDEANQKLFFKNDKLYHIQKIEEEQ